MTNKRFYIYILSNEGGMFYIGVTNSLIRRVWEHKNKVADGFTKKYNITKLIYYEEFWDAANALTREKQLKNWNRKKKIMLINKMNPTFDELKINP